MTTAEIRDLLAIAARQKSAMDGELAWRQAYADADAELLLMLEARKTRWVIVNSGGSIEIIDGDETGEKTCAWVAGEPTLYALPRHLLKREEP